MHLLSLLCFPLKDRRIINPNLQRVNGLSFYLHPQPFSFQIMCLCSAYIFVLEKVWMLCNVCECHDCADLKLCFLAQEPVYFKSWFDLLCSPCPNCLTSSAPSVWNKLKLATLLALLKYFSRYWYFFVIAGMHNNHLWIPWRHCDGFSIEWRRATSIKLASRT